MSDKLRGHEAARFLMVAAGMACCVCPRVGADPRVGQTPPAHGAGPAWQLAWQEEFDGDHLDASRWTRCQRGRADWQNTMSGDPRLLRLDKGILHLRGIVNERPDEDPAPFLTAGVTSRGKYAFQYGKVVIRARFQCAQGAWPALWMLGAEGGWPGGGEIDLMEHLNFDGIVYQTVHSEYTVKIDKTNTPPKGGTAPIERDAWNTYGCEWSPERIVFTVNGRRTHRYPRVAAKGEAQWPFDRPFYFILSMQIGGRWVNQRGPTDPAHYPAGLAVDWIRVYRRGEGPEARDAPARRVPGPGASVRGGQPNPETSSP